MNWKEEILSLLKEQLTEINDHRSQCKLNDCKVLIAILYSVIECIAEDLEDPDYEWTVNDVKDWETTMESKGLCENGLDIYRFVIDCLYKSKEYAKLTKPLGTSVENSCEKVMHELLEKEESKEDEINAPNTRRKLEEQIKLIEESIKMKQTALSYAEETLADRLQEQSENQGEKGWKEFDEEKKAYQIEKEEVLSQLEDIFMATESMKEITELRISLEEQIKGQYKFDALSDIENQLDSQVGMLPFIVEEVRTLLLRLKQWKTKFPLCTDRNITLFIEIERDNQYLNSMLSRVNDVYSNDMLDELEGIHGILQEIENMRAANPS